MTQRSEVQGIRAVLAQDTSRCCGIALLDRRTSRKSAVVEIQCEYFFAVLADTSEVEFASTSWVKSKTFRSLGPLDAGSNDPLEKVFLRVIQYGSTAEERQIQFGPNQRHVDDVFSYLTLRGVSSVITMLARSPT